MSYKPVMFERIGEVVNASYCSGSHKLCVRTTLRECVL